MQSIDSREGPLSLRATTPNSASVHKSTTKTDSVVKLNLQTKCYATRKNVQGMLKGCRWAFLIKRWKTAIRQVDWYSDYSAVGIYTYRLSSDWYPMLGALAL